MLKILTVVSKKGVSVPCHFVIDSVGLNYFFMIVLTAMNNKPALAILLLC